MSSVSRFLTSRWGPILTGAIVGILAPLLGRLGNPGNMGLCMVCFDRDIAGALGLHRANLVQYIRPEIIGCLLGALVAALIFREFKPRTGSAPIVRFFLGMFAVFGALVFLGCPWRAYLRVGGGDWSAIGRGCRVESYRTCIFLGKWTRKSACAAGYFPGCWAGYWFSRPAQPLLH